ncbi:hypothetical protein GCM10008994_06310 [Halorubrum ejinorense]|uniref:Uncharacterized protein n=1 Tax=Halorubrum ejinorense TaxID=425309 RepID=A0AAV3SPF8_9EURY
MGAVPGGLGTVSQPPLTLPLRRFLAGLGLLGAALIVGVGEEGEEAVPAE